MRQFHGELPVRTPYRLDLTVRALRRLSANVVDVVLPDGRYARALSDRHGTDLVEVRQLERNTLDVRIIGPGGRSRMETVAQMLGTAVDLHAWYWRTKTFPWLNELAKVFRGVKPPRYPELWEALCHGIVFQQLSLQAGAAIMQRLVERFSEPLEHEGAHIYPFPRPEKIIGARMPSLRAIGLSAMKASYLRSTARAVLSGAICDDQIRRLPTPVAAAELSKLRGIGPWSASVVLLRGLGRLDTFPMNDSGVARSIALLSGDPAISVNSLLDELGDMRGMLYFHLLLGRLDIVATRRSRTTRS